jgi:diguanylate cyclase (GGDEF)-like protein
VGLITALIVCDGGRTRAHAGQLDRWDAFTVPTFRNYDPDDGLPNPIVTAFAEDGAGFLWVGTQGGLGRWDGYSFRTYKSEAGKSGVLPDNWITCLHTDARGRLWIGTSAGGLAVYDRNRDQFKVYTAGKNALSNVHVTAIADDGAEGLWVATAGGLDHLDPTSGLIHSLHHDAADSGGLPDDRVMALLRDRAGTLWVGTRKGLVQRRVGSRRFDPVSFGPRFDDAIEVANLTEDAGGRVWIGTTKLGAFVLAPLDSVPRAVTETGGNLNLQRQWIYALVDAGPHEIWLGTYGQGIVAVDTETGVTRRITHDPQRPHSVSDDTIWALYRDRAGAVWVGTTVGISKAVSASMDAVLTVAERTPQQLGVRGNDVASVLATTDGRVWAGLQSKGVDILDPSSSRMDSIVSNPSATARALPDTFVLSMAEWSDGGVYIGTNRGLYHSDRNGHAVARLTLPGRDPAARNSALLVRSDTLWIAGTDDGVWATRPGRTGNSIVEHFDGNQLTDTRATALAAGASGDLWIGTNYGLNRLDLNSHRIERMIPDAANPKALATGFISALLLDRSSRLWVGTSGGGVQVLVGRNAGKPVFRRLSTEDGLPDDNVDSLLEDAKGRIWVATDKGIAVVDPAGFMIHALRRADGVSIAAYWAGSAAVTRAGELVFGGIGGMTVIRPERFREWDYRPPIVATEIRVGGQVLAPGRADSQREGAPLLVQPDANRLAVQFAALDMSAPELNRYAYRLEGYDRDWIETDAIRRLAAYSNLPPGDYVLSLRGSNRNGRWTEPPLKLHVRVLPLWYQTLWFKLIAALLGTGGVLALVQVRTLFLRRRQQELERQVRERTMELEESKRLVEKLAYHDALTELSNRRLFNDNMAVMLEQATRHQRRFALLMIDLDRFKQINDTLGHDAGDALLVAAAQRLQVTVRISDRVARLGGDEFAILLDDLSGTLAEQMQIIEGVCGRVIDCFAPPIPFKEAQMKTSASVGVAIYPEHGSTREELCKAADLALYEAKRKGRNGWQYAVRAPLKGSLTHETRLPF